MKTEHLPQLEVEQETLSDNASYITETLLWRGDGEWTWRGVGDGAAVLFPGETQLHCGQLLQAPATDKINILFSVGQ